MITDKELQALKLSPTKQDYYQVWRELLDTAKKLSERWDPTSTNEADPGIVLLKVLTACADKLNYNIDKKILEAFMPTAAQEESMRRICEILGYNMHYFQSATCEASISYSGTGDWGLEGTETIEIPKFTSLKDIDNSINFITTESIILQKQDKTKTVPCIEGQWVDCETNTNNIISIAQLDDQQRYFLPETQIAENGIFVQNLIDTEYSEDWLKVDNLNTQKPGEKVFKFGYDSKELLPYIQFPEDISELIEDGLTIRYIRTRGASGNISANTLSALSKPGSWATSDSDFVKGLSEDDFTVTNISAARGGSNKETLRQAYMNYKKTIGTFDTLVTCRDYMNKIYQLYDDLNVPLVSNIIVSDIRDDLNNAYTLCSFDDFGISYTDMAITENDKQRINNFNLVLYPFKTVYGLNNISEYKDSFTYDNSVVNKDFSYLDNYKTIAHIYKDPLPEDIACIKNYLKLNAKITTTTKVNRVEEADILAKIRISIYDRFNMRNIDFGDEIPFDDILDCIQNADERIKNVSLEEPILYTRIACVNGYEYDVACLAYDEESLKDNKKRLEFVKTLTAPEKTAYANLHAESTESLTEKQISFCKEHQKLTKTLYNKLTLRNVLAGRLNIFNYAQDFKASFTEKAYETSSSSKLLPTYPEDSSNPIVQIEAAYEVKLDDLAQQPITLNDNEVNQFRAPNFMTEITYPAYVNYYFKFSGNNGQKAQPASFISLAAFLAQPEHSKINASDDYQIDKMFKEVDNDGHFKHNSDGSYEYDPNGQSQFEINIPITETSGVYNWHRWAQSLAFDSSGKTEHYSGLFTRVTSTTFDNEPGYLVDSSRQKFKVCNGTVSGDPLDVYYVQYVNQADSTPDGLGKNGTLDCVPKNTEYKLSEGDVLYFNYTKAASTNDDTSSAIKNDQVINVKYAFDPSNPIYIRPNFDLADSDKAHQSAYTSWTKTTGFNSTWGIKGMFCLGSDQQIEIRKPVEVKIHDQADTFTNYTDNYYFYWIVKDEDITKDNNFWPDNETSRVLQEGEYVFYTDSNKASLAYYGNGSEVIRTNTSFNLIKPKNSKLVSAEDILMNGTSVIPWIRQTLGNTNNIIIKEYQYINLVKDCKLKALSLKATNEPDFLPGILTRDWKLVDMDQEVKYEIAGEEGTLDLINLGETSIGWQVRSLLEFNCGPEKTQELHSTESTTDKITLTLQDNTKVELTPQENGDSYKPLAIKTNYDLQTSISPVNTTVQEVTLDGEVKDVDDFKIKVFENTGLVVESETESTTIDLKTATIGDNWYKLAFSRFITDDSKLLLQANFADPDNKFGIFMIYYSTKQSLEFKDTGYMKYTSGTPKIYNLEAGWWTGYSTADNKYHLRPGLNIIQIDTPTTIEIYPDPNKQDSIEFSELQIVDKGNTEGINLELLQYFAVDQNTPAKQLLADINKLDAQHNFYYNIPVEQGIGLEINHNLQNLDSENMLAPRLLYDYNNINNKFVISEIDADFLPAGIVISRSSKL